jgi:hypothetical protein
MCSAIGLVGGTLELRVDGTYEPLRDSLVAPMGQRNRTSKSLALLWHDARQRQVDSRGRVCGHLAKLQEGIPWFSFQNGSSILNISWSS